MSNDFDPSDFADAPSANPDFTDTPLLGDVPRHLDVLPDGREAVVIGDPEGYKDFNHQQGDNPYGFLGTCGLVSCEDVLRQFDLGVTEADIVKHAVENGLCQVSDDPAQSGGTTEFGQARILTDFGIPAHAEFGRSLEDLAENIESGHGAIIEVNAGVLWNDATYYDFGQANHAIVATGVARDPATGEILGFYVNDSGSGASARFLDSSTVSSAWIDAGGSCVITDAIH